MKTGLTSLLFALMLVGQAVADGGSPLPIDGTMMTGLVYSDKDAYTILAQMGKPTHIEFGQDEQIVWVEPGDMQAWEVKQPTDRNLFVKPKMPNVMTAIAVITSKRSYQLKLQSGPEGGKWFQKVSWIYPDVIAAQKKVVETEKARRESEKKLANQSIVAHGFASPENLNSDYSITGSSRYASSVAVMDDGTRTLIKLPSSLRKPPEIFIRRDDGDHALTNFTVKNDFAYVGMVGSTWIIRFDNDLVMAKRGK